MEKEAEKFLKAEETAVKLVEALKQLYSEATSYQTATKELDIVRQRVLNLIESTERVANDSHEVIKILKEIGGPEILHKLTNVENKVSEEALKIGKAMESLKTESLERITEIENKMGEEATKQSKSMDNRIEKLENKLTEEFAKQSKGMEKLKTLIIVTLVSSIMAVITGIIALLR